jgi:hypothetical protein
MRIFLQGTMPQIINKMHIYWLLQRIAIWLHYQEDVFVYWDILFW